MAAASGAPSPPNADQVRAELSAVLASDLFARAPSLAQFLVYICEKALAGEASQIKEYSIAVEALGRQPNFDQKEDAIVRVEAHRLRKRLKQYYESAGAERELRIFIPPGQYVPAFIEKDQIAAVNGGNGATLEPEPVEDLHAPIVLPPATAPALPAPVKRRFFWPAIPAVAFVVLGAGMFIWLSRGMPVAAPGTAELPRAATAPGDGSGGDDDGIRIAAGLSDPKYVDTLGYTWLGDRYFTGGDVATLPLKPILRTHDPVLFRSRRDGTFRYDIPLKPGTYELHLMFAERMFGPGNPAGGGETSRLFHIWVNGKELLRDLDVISDAGASETADTRVFKDISPATDGRLHLEFRAFKESAFVNGIAVLPSTPGRMRPVRILAGSMGFRDRKGRFWTADRFSTGGQVVARTQTQVTGTTDPELYQYERFGNFSYAIPIAEGRYAVTLHFSEAWFGPGKPVGGGEGSRLFDVYANGVALLRSFDIFKTAGAENRAVTRTFRGLTPNAQGKLMLQFVPVKNYACVNAIEVVAE